MVQIKKCYLIEEYLYFLLTGILELNNARLKKDKFKMRMLTNLLILAIFGLANGTPIERSIKLEENISLKDELAKDITLNDEIAKDIILNDEIAKDISLKDELAKDISLSDELVKDISLSDELVEDISLKDELAEGISPKDGDLSDIFEENKVEACTTRECIGASYRILKSMNESVDPCENFFQVTNKTGFTACLKETTIKMAFVFS